MQADGCRLGCALVYGWVCVQRCVQAYMHVSTPTRSAKLDRAINAQMTQAAFATREADDAGLLNRAGL